MREAHSLGGQAGGLAILEGAGGILFKPAQARRLGVVMVESGVCPEAPHVVGWLQGEPLERVDGGTVRLEAKLPREKAHVHEVVAVLGALAAAWGGPLRLEVVATSQGRPTLGFLVSLAQELTAAGSLRELVVFAGPVPVRHIAFLVERASAAFGPPVRIREGRP